MIDIENELITGFHNYLNAIQDDFIRTSKLKITTVFVDKTYTSPVIFFQEIDNHSYEKTATENTQENHAQITYEVNVYNNSARGTTGAKDTTRWFMNLVDEYMLWQVLYQMYLRTFIEWLLDIKRLYLKTKQYTGGKYYGN